MVAVVGVDDSYHDPVVEEVHQVSAVVRGPRVPVVAEEDSGGAHTDSAGVLRAVHSRTVAHHHLFDHHNAHVHSHVHSHNLSAPYYFPVVPRLHSDTSLLSVAHLPTYPRQYSDSPSHLVLHQPVRLEVQEVTRHVRHVRSGGPVRVSRQSGEFRGVELVKVGS